MFIFYFTVLHLILLRVLNLPPVYGPIVENTGVAAKMAAFSKDARTIIISFQSKDVEIYENIGYGFSLKQAINGTTNAEDVSITKSGDYIIFFLQKIFVHHRESEEENYQPYQEILPSGCTVEELEISLDSNFIIYGCDSGKVVILKQNDNNLYEQFQSLNDGTQKVKDLQMKDENTLFVLNNDGNVYIYRKILNIFSLQEVIIIGFSLTSISLQDEKLLVSGFSFIIYYQYDGQQYNIIQIISNVDVLQIDAEYGFLKFCFGGKSGQFKIYQKVNGTYEQAYRYMISTSLGPTKKEEMGLKTSLESTRMDEMGLYYISVASDANMYTFYHCPDECTACSFPNNCSECAEGYLLEGVKCIPEPDQNPVQNPTHCVQNRLHMNNICVQYCHKKCKTCGQTRTDCIECAQFYDRNSDGECVVSNTALDIAVKIRPFINLVRKKGIKFLFLYVDDLWLYQYHKVKYDGIMCVIFKTISFIEEKQWEIIGLEGAIESVKESIKEIHNYSAYSNPAYMFESRNSNFLVDSIVDFLVFYVPFTLATVFLWNKIFYLLFNKEVSKFLRPYSFWLIVADLLVQNNIEFFTFIGFRTLLVFVHFNFATKAMNAFYLFFLLMVILCVVCSYAFYYYKYGKLARYFLVNMYRFQSSYILMIVCYGVRPFLKGLMHAIFYEEWEVQLWSLAGVELLVMITIVVFEVVLDNHKSVMILILELLYSSCFIVMDVLLLSKHKYFAEEEYLRQQIQIILTLTMYLMIIISIMRMLTELKFFLEDCLSCLNCCKKNTAKVSPGQNQIVNEQINREQNKTNLNQNKMKKATRMEKKQRKSNNKQKTEKNQKKVHRNLSSIKQENEKEDQQEERNEVMEYYDNKMKKQQKMEKRENSMKKKQQTLKKQTKKQENKRPEERKKGQVNGRKDKTCKQ